MSKRDLASLICKGLSLYALVLALGPLAGALSSFLSNSGIQRYQSFEWSSALAFNGVPAAFYLAASFLLWLGAEPLARAMAGPEDDARSESGGGGDWASLGAGLVGLLLVALSLPPVARLIVTVWLARITSGGIIGFGSSAGPDIIPQASEVAVRLALGLWLLQGAPGVVRMLRSLRDVGRDEPVAR